MVLFRIENFQQCRARVATEVRTELVDFIEQQHRINRAGLLHHLNNLTGKGADIGAAMTANFCFITHTTQRQANKLTTGGARN